MATIIKSVAIDEAGNTIETPVSGLERLFGVRIDESGRWEWRCIGKDGCNVHKVGYSSGRRRSEPPAGISNRSIIGRQFCPVDQSSPASAGLSLAHSF